MPKYVIERDLPGAGNLSAEELRAISQKSCEVLSQMTSNINWLHSYVTENKIYCIYFAENEDLIREHGAQGGFPVTKITEIAAVIDRATAE